MEVKSYSRGQNIFKNLLGFAMVLAGAGHLTFARVAFQAQVPKWLAIDKDLVVILSGIAEVVFGLALIFLEKQREKIGWFGAFFFIAVFPGNISQYVNQYDAFGLNSDAMRLGRLFFQPVLVFWVLWSTGAWKGNFKY